MKELLIAVFFTVIMCLIVFLVLLVGRNLPDNNYDETKLINTKLIHTEVHRDE